MTRYCNSNKSTTLDDQQITVDTELKLKIKKLSENATIPTKATAGSAGYDLYTAGDIMIEPGDIRMVRTDIAIECPPHSYGRVAPKSGLTVKRQLDIRAGVIDSDYRGNVIMTMHNIGKETQTLKKGDQIAQLIIKKIVNVTLENDVSMTETKRDNKGFGSTSPPPQRAIVPAPIAIPYAQDEIESKIHSIFSETEQRYLSGDPFGPTITMTIKTKGNHKSLGMQLDNRNTAGRLLFAHCEKGTPSAKLKKWGVY